MSAPTEHVPDVRHFLDPATLTEGERIVVYPSARTGTVEHVDRAELLVTIVFDGSADREVYWRDRIRAVRPCPSCDGFLAAGAVAGCCQTCSNDVESDLELVDEDAPDHRAAAYLAAEELLDITTQLDPQFTVSMDINYTGTISVQVFGRQSQDGADALAQRLGLDRPTSHPIGDGETWWEWAGTRHGFAVRVIWIEHRGGES